MPLAAELKTDRNEAPRIQQDPQFSRGLSLNQRVLHGTTSHGNRWRAWAYVHRCRKKQAQYRLSLSGRSAGAGSAMLQVRGKWARCKVLGKKQNREIDTAGLSHRINNSFSAVIGNVRGSLSPWLPVFLQAGQLPEHRGGIGKDIPLTRA